MMSFPCFVAEIENGGMVSVPANDSRGLVVLTDADLADRFAETVSKARQIPVSPIQLNDESELLTHVLTAKQQGASCLVVDPEGFDSPNKQFTFCEVTMDAALRSLESHGDRQT